MTLRFTIMGKPRAWKRARIRRTRRGVSVFTDFSSRALKETIGWKIKEDAPDFKALGRNVPVRLLVKAYFPIPKKTPKALRAKMISETVWYPHKSDWDNLGKLPSDAMNGIAYVDDCQICDGRVLKYYSARPRVEIEIESLEEIT